jgi:uncharacterized protein YcfJ
MTPAIKKSVIITAFAALAVVALAGWTRKASVPPVQAIDTTPAAVAPAASFSPPMTPDGTPVVNSPTPLDRAPAAEPAPAPETANAEPTANAERTAEPAPVRETRSPRVVVRKRPLRNSAAIVGGGAAGGALIGALAGGGKGAAIGAVAGGASGLVYDRLTHEKRVVVR